MTDRERDSAMTTDDPDRLEVEDSGETLEGALAEEERSAIAAAEEKLQSVMADLEELKDRHRRKLAEFENIQASAPSGKSSEYLRTALGKFARDFLTISDDFDRALAHATPEETASDFGQGVSLIQRSSRSCGARTASIRGGHVGHLRPESSMRRSRRKRRKRSRRTRSSR